MTAGRARGGRSGEELSLREARWLAISAQGLGRPLPVMGYQPDQAATGGAAPKRPAYRDRSLLSRAMAQVGTIQIDAVNVLARTHLIVPFSRQGAFAAPALLAMSGPGGPWFEYWGHAASLLPVDAFALFRWRMEDFRRDMGHDGKLHAGRRAWRQAHAAYLAQVLAEVSDSGPLAASGLSESRRQSGTWWDRRSTGRRALELLFADGVLSAWRNTAFERVYDLTERVLGGQAVEAPALPAHDAKKELLCSAARCLGVATLADLADYFWLRPAQCGALLAELVEEGRLRQARVESWAQPAYTLPDARPSRPRRGEATLLSPFDSLIWTRPRTQRLFGFRYRIEIYVPGPQRAHGYYVLPLLLGDALVGRLDLKADRRDSALLVQAAYAEPDQSPAAVASAAWAALERARQWLGLERTLVGGRGDLAAHLAVLAKPPRSSGVVAARGTRGPAGASQLA